MVVLNRPFSQSVCQIFRDHSCGSYVNSANWSSARHLIKGHYAVNMIGDTLGEEEDLLNLICSVD